MPSNPKLPPPLTPAQLPAIPPSASPPKPGQPARPKGTSTLLMLLSSAIMLSLLFPPFYCFFLAPIALVPFCICILRRPLRPRFLAAYYALGVAFFLPMLFWIAPVTIGGYIALALFVALYFPLFALGLHRLVIQLRLPATFAVPLVWTAVEYLRSCYVLGGFPWFPLGNALAPMPLLIQTADLFGVWGLTFLIALLNGFLVDLLRLPLTRVVNGRARFSPSLLALAAIAGLTVVFIFSYGLFRTSERTTLPGPTIAVIQENIPQALKDDESQRDDVFLKHLALTFQAARSSPKPDLIAWPETMATAPINDELIAGRPDPFTTPEELREALKQKPGESTNHHELRRIDDIYQALLNAANETQIPLLVGYGALVPQDNLPAIIQNRTVLLMPKRLSQIRSATRPTDSRAAEYSKVHLVPFGEFIPFRGVPGLSQLMLYFSPVNFDYSNTPGQEWTRFHLTINRPTATAPGAPPAAETFTFATPICFEDTMPEPPRMMSAPQFSANNHGIPGRKTDFLINVSNDGWFFATELDQHLQAAQLRAVENRITIARSVNTGNSGFIDSNGRILKLVTDARGRSTGAVGTASAQLSIDSRITFYSRVGDILPIICGITATLLTAFTFVRPRRSPRA